MTDMRTIRTTQIQNSPHETNHANSNQNLTHNQLIEVVERTNDPNNQTKLTLRKQITLYKLKLHSQSID